MIHFEAASYLTQDEKESYTWEALLGEVGGNLGLMVGCSVLTAAEILHLIALLIYKGFQRFGAKQRKVNLSKECEQPTM
ncbi:Acid-sensing ion channel 4 [Exaiptasia diaphana]|nr:Acid-sensing ion channel 4 [Exaiptasia diaphana]